MLCRRVMAAGVEPDVAWIHVDNAPSRAARLIEMVEQRREGAVPVVEPRAGGGSVWRLLARMRVR